MDVSQAQEAISEEAPREYPPQRIRLYGHAACPALPPVRGMLEKSSVDYEYINIHHDAEGRRRVLEINNGYASVPTLEFPDGTTLTEPTGSEISYRLKKLGYKVPIHAWLVGNARLLIVGAVIVYALLRFFGVF